MGRLLVYVLVVSLALGLLVCGLDGHQHVKLLTQVLSSKTMPNVSNYSPDRTYHRGDLVVMQGKVYRVLTTVGPKQFQQDFKHVNPRLFKEVGKV